LRINGKQVADQDASDVEMLVYGTTPGDGEVPTGWATLTGTIKKLVTQRGFGFLSWEDGKEYSSPV
jgi:hypothetical protein